MRKMRNLKFNCYALIFVFNDEARIIKISDSLKILEIERNSEFETMDDIDKKYFVCASIKEIDIDMFIDENNFMDSISGREIEN
jgi:hypothetical protein